MSGAKERIIEVIKVHEEKPDEEGKEAIKWFKLSRGTIEKLVKEMGGAKKGGVPAMLDDLNKDKEGWVLAKQLSDQPQHHHHSSLMPDLPEVEWTKVELAQSPNGGGGGGAKSVGGGGGGGAKGAGAGAGAAAPEPVVLLTTADWQCAKCTYVNAKASPVCEMCNEAQPTA